MIYLAKNPQHCLSLILMDFEYVVEMLFISRAF